MYTEIPLRYFNFPTADVSVGTDDMAMNIIILSCSIKWFLADDGNRHLQH